MSYALRLTFEYEAGRWTLRRARRVQMRVPPDGATQRLAAGAGAGAWIEVRGAGGEPLYRRAISRSVVSDDVEVLTDDPRQRLARRPGARRTGTLQVVVPDLREAREVVVLERRPARAAGARLQPELVEHARVDLRQLGAADGGRS